MAWINCNTGAFRKAAFCIYSTDVDLLSRYGTVLGATYV